MPPRRIAAFALAVASVLPAGTALAAGNAANGANLFATYCSECHSAREGKDKKGPSMFAVVGRPTATIAGFNYSDALKRAGFNWTAENLDAYMAEPGKRVPGGKMKFDGVASAAERADLLAYLETLVKK